MASGASVTHLAFLEHAVTETATRILVYGGETHWRHNKAYTPCNGLEVILGQLIAGFGGGVSVGIARLHRFLLGPSGGDLNLRSQRSLAWV